MADRNRIDVACGARFGELIAASPTASAQEWGLCDFQNSVSVSASGINGGPEQLLHYMASLSSRRRSQLADRTILTALSC